MSLSLIRAQISTAALKHGRQPQDITLIAVSKRQPEARIMDALTAGQTVFGENYLQEAAMRWPHLTQMFTGLELHMIGPLQSNKVKAAMALFHAIHSLDRPELAEKIARRAQEIGACPKLFVQVNTGDEPQKAGIHPKDLDAFVKKCREKDLQIQGLMCIPPETEPADTHFHALAQMAARNGIADLSMGMSADFETAIARGATHIRVGSAIFGAREK